MNRVIKFRAWDKKRKKMWHQRDSWVFDSEYDDLCFSFNFKHSIVNGNEEDFELMQFTGLLDKNGVEIYEGDIVEFSKSSRTEEIIRLEVKWFQYSGHQGWWPNEIEDMSVIGNIYENLAPRGERKYMKTVTKELKNAPIKIKYLPKSTKIIFMHISYGEIVYNSLSWFEKLRLNFFVKVVLPHSVLTIEKHK